MGRDKSERSSEGSITRSQGQKNLESDKLRQSTKVSLNQGKASERSKTLVSGASDIKVVLNPLGPFSGGWDTLLLLSSVIAVSLDPLFFYLLMVNEDKKCLFMDRKLGIAAMVLRSVLDGLYIIYVTCRVLSPAANKGGNSSRDARSTARGYFLSRLFLTDIVAILPLPQIYLQSKTIKLEELRLRNQEIEQWKPFKKLPKELQKQIKKYQRYKWQQSRGIDVENLLNTFPREITKNIKRELCLELLKKVKHFSRSEKMLNELCYYAKPVLFIERSYVRKEGEPIDEMLFIVQGKLRTYSSSGSDDFGYLEDGDFCGEELLEEWLHCHQPVHLPTSTRNIQALTKVEAYSLLAVDLKRVKIWATRQMQSALRSRNLQRRQHRDVHIGIDVGDYVLASDSDDS